MEQSAKAHIENEIYDTRARIADLLLKIDYIELQENPQIKTEYATKIGYLENDLLKWQIAARRAKRRFTLAQARINSGMSFKADEFEEQLNEELAEWENKLTKSIQDFLKLAERASSVQMLSPTQAREIKDLHRMIIKRLHPDLHPNLDPEAERFFHAAQNAYENGDLELLRSIAVATEGMEEEDPISYMDEAEISIELELLLGREHTIEQKLETLKNSNPYTLKEKLQDGAWVIEQTTRLKEQIEEQKEAAKVYDERFLALANESANGEGASNKSANGEDANE